MKKYISQINNQNFVYPNNNPAEYDVTINHEINDNCVSGTTKVGPDERLWDVGDELNTGEFGYTGATSAFTSITVLLISYEDNGGYNQSAWLGYLDIGDTISLYNQTQKGNHGIYTISSNPTFPVPGYIRFEVTNISGSGTAGVSDEVLFELNKNSNELICKDSNITVTSSELSGITLNYSWSWDLNGAEPFINADGDQIFFSIHALAPETEYYKPWYMVGYHLDTYSGVTSTSGTGTLTITPDQFGLVAFQNGNYYFEFRYIGHRCVYPVAVCAVIDDISPADNWELTDVQIASSDLMELTHTGDTTYCYSVQSEWSYDNIGWFANSPSTDYCTSPAYCKIGPQYGIRWFRLVQFFTYGGSITSNVLSYNFGEPLLDSVETGATTGNTYEVVFSGLTDCSGIVIEWSRNQVDWIAATAELDCDVSQPYTVDTGDDSDIPYWRIKQITGLYADTKEDTYSNIITVTY